MQIRPYDPADQPAVIALWQACGLVRPKINLQVRAGNGEALAFYRALGYATDDVVSLGKRLAQDDPT